MDRKGKGTKGFVPISNYTVSELSVFSMGFLGFAYKSGIKTNWNFSSLFIYSIQFFIAYVMVSTMVSYHT